MRKTMFQKFIDMKISLPTLVGWLVALVGATATVSSMYGEQKQKLLYLAERQTKIELALDRIESSQTNLLTTIARIEVEWRGRISPTPSARTKK